MIIPKIIFVSLFSLLIIFSRAQSGLTEVKQHGSNPGNLNMFIHIPKTWNDSAGKKPLVVVLHGCSQNAEIVSRQSGWNKLADEFNFYVLYPQQKILNNPSDCFNWFRKDDITKNKGEVLSIKQMIDFVIDSFAVDTNKIFAYGLSAGAAMSVALLADYPYVFNAGAILAGGPYMCASNPVNALAVMAGAKNKSAKEWGELVKKQNPGYEKKYPRLIIMHGTADNIVNIKNSYQLIKQWTYLHHTDTIADKKIESFANHPDIVKNIYSNSKNNEVVIFYEVNNLGHALMIDPGEGIEKGGETGIFAVDKDFYSTYWIAVDFGLIKKSE